MALKPKHLLAWARTETGQQKLSSGLPYFVELRAK
jgi:hypothetical protein